MFIQKVNMDVQLVDSNLQVVPALQTAIRKLKHQSQKLTCRLRAILEHGFLENEAVAEYKPCPPLPAYVDSAMLFYTINFTVETRFLLESHIAHVNHKLSE